MGTVMIDKKRSKAGRAGSSKRLVGLIFIFSAGPSASKEEIRVQIAFFTGG